MVVTLKLSNSCWWVIPFRPFSTEPKRRRATRREHSRYNIEGRNAVAGKTAGTKKSWRARIVETSCRAGVAGKKSPGKYTPFLNWAFTLKLKPRIRYKGCRVVCHAVLRSVWPKEWSFPGVASSTSEGGITNRFFDGVEPNKARIFQKTSLGIFFSIMLKSWHCALCVRISIYVPPDTIDNTWQRVAQYCQISDNLPRDMTCLKYK